MVLWVCASAEQSCDKIRVCVRMFFVAAATATVVASSPYGTSIEWNDKHE